DRWWSRVRAVWSRSSVWRIDHAGWLSYRRRAGSTSAHRACLLRAVGRGRYTRRSATLMLSVPIIVALVVVAFLTAGGMAVRSVSRIWLRHWAERQLRGAEAAMAYLERPHRLLTAANAGVALTLLISGMIVGIAARGIGVIWEALAFA